MSRKNSKRKKAEKELLPAFITNLSAEKKVLYMHIAIIIANFLLFLGIAMFVYLQFVAK